MFQGCTILPSLDLSGFNTVATTNVSSMFSDCGGLTTLDVSRLTTTNLIFTTNMFAGCTLGLKTNLYKTDMSGYKIYLYDKHSKADLTTTNLADTENNIVYQPYAITQSTPTNCSFTTSSRFNAADYENYFNKTAGFYTSGAPTYDSNKGYGQQGETMTITAKCLPAAICA